MFKRTKKTISGVLATLIFVSLFAGVPVFANNISTYIYNGYTVEYFIDAEWQGHQNISVTLINTSDENLVDWALKFDASGDIITIWNGEISENNDTEYIITHAGWNREIWAGHRTSFGYIVAGDTLFAPLKFEIGPDFDSGDTSQDEPEEPKNPGDTNSSGENENDEEIELFDIGEIYFKDIVDDEDIDFGENGVCFVKNQILLTAYDDVGFEMVEALVKKLYS
ncbi:MAG: cellulose binding domain-containing protein [Oscillospiraceae bacterium]|nr:cellulose binding domain-containing protein [Oscillospiraceae bacterium]